MRETKQCRVITFGREGNPLTQTAKVEALAKRERARSLHIIDPPTQVGGPGWHHIATEYTESCTRAEGGVLTKKGQSLLIHSRDCHVLVLENLLSGLVGATHVGRESLINRRSPCCRYVGVVERLIGELGILDGSLARAYITAGISGVHFEHPDWTWVKPFVKEYGPNVVTDHSRATLDLVAVIRAKLDRYGIRKVEHDGLCTVDTPWLGSKRAGKDGANWIFVVKTA